MTQCTANSHHTRQQCRLHAVPGRATCRFHGGKTPLGPLNPQWKDGRKSKLPQRMVDAFERTLADENRLALLNELAVIDARVDDLLTRCDSGEGGWHWRQLSEIAQAQRAAFRDNDLPLARRLCEQIVGLVTAGKRDWDTWDEIASQVQLRARLAESERKRLIEDRQVIDVAEAMQVMNVLINSVQRHVTDPAAVRAIAADFAVATGRADVLPAMVAAGRGR